MKTIQNPQGPTELAMAISECAHDALARMEAVITSRPEEDHLVPNYRDLDIHLWKQSWSDTSCGFGGIGGQAITRAYTLVFIDEYLHLGGAVVYHNFRFAGHVQRPNHRFFEDVQRRQIRGAAKDWSIYEHQFKEGHIILSALNVLPMKK